MIDRVSIVRGAVCAAVLHLAAAGCGGPTPAAAPSAPAAAAPLADRSFVLVHGAWMGAWSWDAVAAGLRARGAEVQVVELPGHGADQTAPGTVTLDGYVAAVGAALEQARAPAILVGHSMGGMVITGAAEPHRARIDRLIYVAAYVPRDGEALGAIAGHDAASHVGPVLQIDGAAGLARLPATALRDVFCADCDDAAAARLAERYRDEPLPPFGAPVRRGAAWDAAAKYYVYTAADQAVSPALQQEMTAGVTWADSATLPTGHAPMLSSPDALVDVLARFAVDAR